MSVTTFPITAKDVAEKSSIFEIDETLDALVETADIDAEASKGEVSDAARCALATYAEALGFKVDRIADYLKSQKPRPKLRNARSSGFTLGRKRRKTASAG